jgi:hypothetical protein
MRPAMNGLKLAGLAGGCADWTRAPAWTRAPTRFAARSSKKVCTASAIHVTSATIPSHHAPIITPAISTAVGTSTFTGLASALTTSARRRSLRETERIAARRTS